MARVRPLPRLACALLAAIITTLSVAGAGPAAAEDQATIDVLKIVDGEYVVETVTVPARNAEESAEEIEAAPDVVVASPSVTYEVAGSPDPFWDPTDPQATSAVKDVWPRTRGEGQIVAVLDTAASFDHPDLEGAAVPGTDTIGGAGEPWHGSGVAGVIAARAENGTGSAGMAPAARVMPVRVCNDAQGCPSANVAEGIFWAVDHGADVINMSLAGAGYSDVTAAAVQYALDKNIAVVASSGNDGLNGNPVMYPAANSGVIAVSSTTPAGVPSDWAVHGWQVDISTVGDSVLLTMPGGSYAAGSGTSFSGPAVAGAAALLRSAVPGITPEQVQAALQAGADSTGTWNREYGAGRLHMPSAVDAADRADGGVVVTPSPGTLDITWDAVPGAADYAVRVDGVVRATVTGTTAQVTGLTNGNQIAVDVQPNGGQRTLPVLATVGAAAPGTPVLAGGSLRGTSSSAIVDLQASVTGASGTKLAIIRDGVGIGTINRTLTSSPQTLSIGIGPMPTVETNWQLRSVDALGRTSAASNAVTVGSGRPPAPGAVTGLAGRVDGEEVLLTWDDLGTAYSYRVTSGGDVLATPLTAGAAVPGPAIGQTLNYEVLAVDTWGQTGPATDVDVHRVAPPVMTVPPSVVGTLVVGQTVSTPDAFTGADTITRTWRACINGTCGVVTGDTTHVIGASELGRTLEVEVVARNSGGTTSAVSARSAVIASEAAQPTPPGPPVIGTPTAGRSSAVVRWSPPASNGGATITSYSVRIFENGSLVRAIPQPAGATQVTVSGLTNGEPHTFAVAAANSYGTGQPSAHSDPVVPRTSPSAPVIGTPSPGAASAVVRWSPPSTDGGSPVTRYLVRAYRGSSLVRTATAAPGATSVTVTGLANGVAHTFLVSADNAYGSSPVSARSAAVTPRDRPGAPRIGTPTAGNAAILVRWAQPLTNGGLPVTAYVVRTYRNGTLVLSTSVSRTATSYLQRGLRNGTAYTVTVTAVNGAGWGPQSRAVGSVPRR